MPGIAQWHVRNFKGKDFGIIRGMNRFVVQVYSDLRGISLRTELFLCDFMWNVISLNRTGHERDSLFTR